MSKLANLKAGLDDRYKVNAWLDHINCTNPQERGEVLEKCKTDPEARAYFVKRWTEDVK